MSDNSEATTSAAAAAASGRQTSEESVIAIGEVNGTARKARRSTRAPPVRAAPKEKSNSRESDGGRGGRGRGRGGKRGGGGRKKAEQAVVVLAEDELLRQSADRPSPSPPADEPVFDEDELLGEQRYRDDPSPSSSSAEDSDADVYEPKKDELERADASDMDASDEEEEEADGTPEPRGSVEEVEMEEQVAGEEEDERDEGDDDGDDELETIEELDEENESIGEVPMGKSTRKGKPRRKVPRVSSNPDVKRNKFGFRQAVEIVENDIRPVMYRKKSKPMVNTKDEPPNKRTRVTRMIMHHPVQQFQNELVETTKFEEVEVAPLANTIDKYLDDSQLFVEPSDSLYDDVVATAVEYDGTVKMLHFGKTMKKHSCKQKRTKFQQSWWSWDWKPFAKMRSGFMEEPQDLSIEILSDPILFVQHFLNPIRQPSELQKHYDKIQWRTMKRRSNNEIIRDSTYFVREFFLLKAAISLRIQFATDIPVCFVPPMLNCGYFPHSAVTVDNMKHYLMHRYLEAQVEYVNINYRSIEPPAPFVPSIITSDELFEFHKLGRHIHGFFLVWSVPDEPFRDQNGTTKERRYLVDMFNFIRFPLYAPYERWEVRLKVAFDRIIAYNLHLSELMRVNRPVFDCIGNSSALYAPMSLEEMCRLMSRYETVPKHFMMSVGRHEMYEWCRSASNAEHLSAYAIIIGGSKVIIESDEHDLGHRRVYTTDPMKPVIVDRDGKRYQVITDKPIKKFYVREDFDDEEEDEIIRVFNSCNQYNGPEITRHIIDVPKTPPPPPPPKAHKFEREEQVCMTREELMEVRCTLYDLPPVRKMAKKSEPTGRKKPGRKAVSQNQKQIEKYDFYEHIQASDIESDHEGYISDSEQMIDFGTRPVLKRTTSCESFFVEPGYVSYPLEQLGWFHQRRMKRPPMKKRAKTQKKLTRIVQKHGLRYRILQAEQGATTEMLQCYNGKFPRTALEIKNTKIAMRNSRRFVTFDIPPVYALGETDIVDDVSALLKSMVTVTVAKEISSIRVGNSLSMSNLKNINLRRERYMRLPMNQSTLDLPPQEYLSMEMLTCEKMTCREQIAQQKQQMTEWLGERCDRIERLPPHICLRNVLRAKRHREQQFHARLVRFEQKKQSRVNNEARNARIHNMTLISTNDTTHHHNEVEEYQQPNTRQNATTPRRRDEEPMTRSRVRDVVVREAAHHDQQQQQQPTTSNSSTTSRDRDIRTFFERDDTRRVDLKRPRDEFPPRARRPQDEFEHRREPPPRRDDAERIRKMAEETKLAEQRARAEQERKIAEQQRRIDEERAAAEEHERAEQERLRAAQRAREDAEAEEERVAQARAEERARQLQREEEQRLADEREAEEERAEQERIARARAAQRARDEAAAREREEQERAAQEEERVAQARAEERARQLQREEEQRLAEEQEAEEERVEQERIAKIRAAEREKQKRLQEQRKAEEARIVEQKRLEQQRAAEEQRREQQREQQRIQEQKEQDALRIRQVRSLPETLPDEEELTLMQLSKDPMNPKFQKARRALGCTNIIKEFHEASEDDNDKIWATMYLNSATVSAEHLIQHINMLVNPPHMRWEITEDVLRRVHDAAECLKYIKVNPGNRRWMFIYDAAFLDKYMNMATELRRVTAEEESTTPQKASVATAAAASETPEPSPPPPPPPPARAFASPLATPRRPPGYRGRSGSRVGSVFRAVTVIRNPIVSPPNDAPTPAHATSSSSSQHTRLQSVEKSSSRRAPPGGERPFWTAPHPHVQPARSDFWWYVEKNENPHIDEPARRAYCFSLDAAVQAHGLSDRESVAYTLGVVSTLCALLTGGQVPAKNSYPLLSLDDVKEHAVEINKKFHHISSYIAVAASEQENFIDLVEFNGFGIISELFNEAINKIAALTCHSSIKRQLAGEDGGEVPAEGALREVMNALEEFAAEALIDMKIPHVNRYVVDLWRDLHREFVEKTLEDGHANVASGSVPHFHPLGVLLLDMMKRKAEGVDYVWNKVQAHLTRPSPEPLVFNIGEHCVDEEDVKPNADDEEDDVQFVDSRLGTPAPRSEASSSVIRYSAGPSSSGTPTIGTPISRRLGKRAAERGPSMHHEPLPKMQR